MEIGFCENVIVKFLFTNLELRERTIHYIVPEIFDDYSNITIIRTLKEFFDKYERFPSVNEMKLELPGEPSYKKLIENLNINLNDYSPDYLLNECETFIRVKLTANHFYTCLDYLKECKFDKTEDYPDKIRESLSFSFDTNLGLDFLEDEERIYNFLHNRDTVVPYNISFFDRNMKGGAHEKSLTLFLAETNLGKTLLMCAFAANNIRMNRKVLYISCEMHEEKISERILANIWDHDIGDLDIINRDIFHNRFVEMKNTVHGNLQIKGYPPRAINANNIRNLLKEYEIKKRFKPDIIYLDYLELVNPTTSRKSDNSYSDGKRTAEEIRAVAVEYGIPIVSALQTNRAGMGASDLDMKNTSDSIGFAFTADVVIGVSQSEQFREENKFSVNILKNRYGGNKLKGAIAVDKPKMRVGNLADDEEENMETLRRPARPEQGMPLPPVQRAMSAINDGLIQAQNSANEAMFGDWE